MNKKIESNKNSKRIREAVQKSLKKSFPKSQHAHKSPGPLSGPSLPFLALKEFVQTAGLHFAQPNHKLGQ